MLFEIIFSAAALICIARLCAFARICIKEKNICGAIVLFIICAALITFSVLEFLW